MGFIESFFRRIVFIEKSEGSLLSFFFHRISTSHFSVYSPMNFHVHFGNDSVTTKIVRPSFRRVERFFNKGKYNSISLASLKSLTQVFLTTRRSRQLLNPLFHPLDKSRWRPFRQHIQIRLRLSLFDEPSEKDVGSCGVFGVQNAEARLWVVPLLATD